MTDELFGCSSDHPGMTKARRQALERLASGKAGPALAEMARDLLSGRTSPAQLMASGAYGEELGQHLSRFSSWFGGLSDQEKEDVTETGLRTLEELAREELRPPEPPARPHRRVHRDDEDEDDVFTGIQWQ